MSPTLPMICGTLLAAMLGAGFCHFWSVQDIVSNFPTTPAVRSLPAYLRESPTPQDPPAAVLPPDMASAPTPQPGDSQKEFFEGLLAEVRALRNENRNLIDQVGETNRDMMKMQFRLDTHSASFRPLPTSEERDDTSNYRGDIPSGVDEDFPGVLPPRASPVYPLEE